MKTFFFAFLFLFFTSHPSLFAQTNERVYTLEFDNTNPVEGVDCGETIQCNPVTFLFRTEGFDGEDYCTVTFPKPLPLKKVGWVGCQIQFHYGGEWLAGVLTNPADMPGQLWGILYSKPGASGSLAYNQLLVERAQKKGNVFVVCPAGE